MMNLSRAGAADIRLHEGFVGKYYLDPVGIGTIGVGFTWASPAFRRWWGAARSGQAFGPGATMTRTEADEALQFIVAEQYGKAVNEFMTGQHVAQNVYDGMVSVVFNCGEGSLDWKWAQAIKRGDIADGARLLETTATTAQGKKLAGLVARRKDEARLIRDGVYTSGTAVGPSWPADTDKSDDDFILERGERGEAVRKMQVALQGADFYSGIIDGIFGIGTDQAVREFQGSKKLTIDGKAGPQTLKALGLSLAS